MVEQKKQSESPKLREKCPYGFNCGSMMLQPGTIAHNCENLTECTKLTKAQGVSWTALNQPTFDLVEYRENLDYHLREEAQHLREEAQRRRYILRVRVHEAAVLLLKQRGNPQSVENFNFASPLSQIEQSLENLNSHLENLDSGYIAPSGVEAHVYNVKNPPTSYFSEEITLEEIREKQKIYYYHKLLSKTAQFESVKPLKPGEVRKNCKTIHLSHGGDARNIQGRIGIERRNRLSKIQSRLLAASKALQEAAELAAADYNYEDVLAASQESEGETN